MESNSKIESVVLFAAGCAGGLDHGAEGLEEIRSALYSTREVRCHKVDHHDKLEDEEDEAAQETIPHDSHENAHDQADQEADCKEVARSLSIEKHVDEESFKAVLDTERAQDAACTDIEEQSRLLGHDKEDWQEAKREE